MFLVLKRTVSLRLSFEYPQHMFWLRNKKIKNRYALLTKFQVEHEKFYNLGAWALAYTADDLIVKFPDITVTSSQNSIFSR